ncbi:MAG: 16S rRNA (guanine(527)-N(7))-methyltransferase RsmG [Clostridia bacterium]|nr:16S rRNA (guanine(527)-N(7))-methyltransferase RsmG [Clostridia bacterium]
MNYEEFSEIFNTVLADNGLSHFAGETESRMFYQLTERMLQVNRSMNLTAIKEERAVILRHYADSLTVAAFLPQNASVIDVGCGAGFPCLPLAICRPDLTITALDSTEKRIRYVAETATLLQRERFSAVAARAEELARTPGCREHFDCCTARAVASLPILSELCLPFVRVGGTFIAMKAARGEEELQAAEKGIQKLGGEVAAIHHVTLHDGDEQDTRMLIEIKKVKATPPELPRPFGKISKKPL